MKDLQKENDELRAKLDKYEKSSCQTCYGAGTVLISPDDGMDCPECAQWLAEIRAEAVMNVANNWVVENDHDYVVRQKLINHANRIKESE